MAVTFTIVKKLQYAILTLMKTREMITDDKLRGGFYSPRKLVDICILRALSHQRKDKIEVLEPSCGDGAFIEGISRTPIYTDVNFLGIEVVKEEAEKSRALLSKSKVSGKIINNSFFDTYDSLGEYDVILGNPPYIRYQFINNEDIIGIRKIADKLDVDIKKVGNIWIPIVIGALSKLREGGSFAIIIPEESLAGVSALQFRKWIMENCRDIKIDIFPPKIFPQVLQETLIMSGQKGEGNNTVQFIQHYQNQPNDEWQHTIVNHDTWYRYLLDGESLDIYSAGLNRLQPLVKIAKFDVSIVTGANDYFCIDRNTVIGFGLENWSRPLLARTRESAGIVYTHDDYENSVMQGKKAYILDFSESMSEPLDFPRAADYIAIGEEFKLHERYKCSIRKPWYRIPNMVSYELLMSKRSHFSPRVIVNSANVLTTDTIYRGRINKNESITPEDFSATFHNSMTLLSAEIEGRSFGGGVLELVPSEVSRLRIEALPKMGRHLHKIDKLFRDISHQPDFHEAVTYTDELIANNGSIFLSSDLEKLSSSLQKMRTRRLSRN